MILNVIMNIIAKLIILYFKVFIPVMCGLLIIILVAAIYDDSYYNINITNFIIDICMISICIVIIRVFKQISDILINEFLLFVSTNIAAFFILRQIKSRKQK